MRVSAVMIPIVLFICVAATIIGVPIAKAYARRMDREPRQPSLPPDVTARLERMEQAIDYHRDRSRANLRRTALHDQAACPSAVERAATCRAGRHDRPSLLVMQGPDDIPPGAIEISEAFFTTVVIIALGIPIIRAITRRWERAAPAAAAPRRPTSPRDSSASSRRSKPSRSKSSASPKRSASRPSSWPSSSAAFRAPTPRRSLAHAERSDHRRRAEHSAHGRRAAERRGLRGARRARRSDRTHARDRDRAGRRAARPHDARRARRPGDARARARGAARRAGRDDERPRRTERRGEGHEARRIQLS